MGRRRKILILGGGFLPMLLGDAVYRYRVTKDVLPSDATIVDAQMTPNGRDVALLIESEDFAEVPEGRPYPEIEPQLTRVATHLPEDQPFLVQLN